jgi:hypothetical protein
VDTALADLMRAEITHRFADRSPQIGEGSEIATFTCPSGSLGEVLVELDDAGVVVAIEGMWHGHFDQGTPQEVVTACTGFLDDLFHDRVVVWVARRDGRALGGGTFDREVGLGSWYRDLSRDADDVRAGSWSGPWVDEVIASDS